ncbi:isochorismatase family protein [Orbus wheelerorum]|uniref:isochorismatase family protein n=1 Tax=Orbus wheelerorum TaxID=3074111 RepID=UPI00370D730B
MNKALLIIDVQEGLFSPYPQPYQTDLVISNINQLIAKAIENNVPIIFIQHENNHDLSYNSANWQHYHKLNTAIDNIYIRKTTPNAFLKTDLLTCLEQFNIEQCIVCGYASEFCIDTTVRQAAAFGFNVMLVCDAHTTHDKHHAKADNIIQHHNNTLTDLTSFGVNIAALATNDIQF